uniref:EF-hand domain-containing protein n=1 Tax=Arcella intermedia TaxID=1963864 RepID=A0A6B2LHS4_9EUKA
MAGLKDWFVRVDTDRSGTIEISELQHVTFDRIPIGMEVAAKLVQVFDSDRNGKIDFVEYASMHKFISHMRQAFLNADADKSGRIEAKEIFEALRGAGFNYLTLPTVQELLNKFDKSRRGLDWREFLMMVAHIAHVRSVFQWNDTKKTGQITLSSDQLTHISAYLLDIKFQ